MGLDRRRARRAVDRRVSEPQERNSGELGELVGTAEDIADNPAYFDRGYTFDDGRLFTAGDLADEESAVAIFGQDHFDRNGLFSSASSTSNPQDLEAAHFDRGDHFGDGSTFGGGGEVQEAESTVAVFGEAYFDRRYTFGE